VMMMAMALIGSGRVFERLNEAICEVTSESVMESVFAECERVS
jgi:hypothetical protein